MEPIPPKKRFLSKASVIHHNKGTKRPMLQRDINETQRKPLEAFPAVQKECGDKCKQPGCQLLTLPERQHLYKTFFLMTDDEKYMFQSLLMSCEDPVPEPESKTRMYWNYKLPIIYAKVDVCQTTFRKTINVSDSQISRIQKRMVECQEIFPRNMRGRHDNRPHRLLDDTIKLIKDHLESYDAVENHYTRNKYDETVTFLPAHHTIKQLHLDYLDVHGHDCPELETADNADEKTQLQHQKQSHLAMADLTSNTRKQDMARAKIDSNFIVLSVDMQQTFFTPKLTNASSFYLRKFCTYNLGIHDENQNRGHMFIWNETDAKKGADEVASCLYRFVLTRFEPTCAERTLVVWTDRCVGQNNNYTMLVFYRKIIQDGYYSNIYQKFAISGHSYLSCDTDFSFIERQLKKFPPITPNDLLMPILKANSVAPFEIHKMTLDHFYDLKRLVSYWKRPVNLKISQFHLIFQHRALPNRILAKHSHSDTEDWVTFENKFRNRHIDPIYIPEISGLLKYNGLLPLKVSKQIDLTKMMKFLTAADKEFFIPFLNISMDQETVNDET
ncbi:unnamed protein product [Allacma fusca]|uniref:DUF7869 domain-containing protein n=1 Tax=Allacma fusca TaxID=39272 RepID=A0A8J2PJH7_9HEXA|nr:unnamed protein product [Allacma fusca]